MGRKRQKKSATFRKIILKEVDEAVPVSMLSTDVCLDAGEESISIEGQEALQEDQSESRHVASKFVEEIVIKNTFLQVVRKKIDRLRAGSTPWSWKPVGGLMGECGRLAPRVSISSCRRVC